MFKFLISFLLLVECFAFETGWSGRVTDVSNLSAAVVTMLKSNYKLECVDSSKSDVLMPSFVVIHIDTSSKGSFDNIQMKVIVERAITVDDKAFLVNVDIDFEAETGLYTATHESMSSLCF